MQSDSAVQSSPAQASKRLVSLDALRGFDMFWIMGGDSIGHALEQMHGAGLLGVLGEQLNHVKWEGFRFYDLIFPLFVFIVGVSLVFSLSRILRERGRPAALGRILRRTVLLYALGILYYGGLAKGLSDIRLLGVLQRIALCYGAAGVLFCFLKPRGLMVACAGLLVGYWAMMTFIPVPGAGAGNFAEGANLANWIDSQYLPWRKWDKDHDPEGLLSTVPAVGTCLLGVLAGILLQSSERSAGQKIRWLLAGSLAGVALGFLWGLQFPVIKKIWTSSYVLVAGGYSALLLAAFYWVIDVRGWKRWAAPFVWIGSNSITIYLLGNVMSFDLLAARFAGGPVQAWMDGRFGAGWGELGVSLTGMVLAVWVCRFLHQKKVFLRL